MKGSIIVINGKTDGFIGKDKIYIGRYNSKCKLAASPLRNPYIVGIHGDLQEVLWLYKEHLFRLIKQKDSEVIKELHHIASMVRDGKTVKLACWCAPNPCHGDIVKKIVEKMLK